MPIETLGATPEGAADEQSASAAVQSMFNSIAPRYDLLNHLLSANIDRLWWASTARRFQTVLADPQAAILDVCCGTGDMTMALLKRRPAGASPILAADFAHEMLIRGEKKFGQRPTGGIDSTRPYAIPIEADALNLPLAPASLDLVTTAFGFRNLANYRAGLKEFHRVLKPGGQLGILDFSEPSGLLGPLYRIYFRRVLPAIGRRFSGSGKSSQPTARAVSQPGPYNYLPASVSKFPPPPEMQAMMRSAGFENVQWTPYTFGIAGLYTGVKARAGIHANRVPIADCLAPTIPTL